MLKPFDYQIKAVNECIDALKSLDRVILDACVGSGKSVMAAMFCEREISMFGKVLMLVPSTELLAQNKNKLDSLLGVGVTGICSASAGNKDISRQITVGTIGTIINQELTGITLCIIDECHLVNNTESGRYRELLKRIGCKAIGMTGTPFRGVKSEWLTNNEESFFQSIASTISMRDMMARGQIVPLITKQAMQVMAGADFTVKNGDYDEGEQEKAVKDRLQDIINAILAMPEQKIMVFAVNVRSCEDITNLLGEKATCVHGGTKDRAERIDGFRSGKYRYMVSVNALNTGFDVPNVDALVNVRLIRTPATYGQTCGRGMRSYPGKFSCAWYDFTDTTKRLGPVEDAGRDVARAKKRKGGGGGESFITCPACAVVIKSTMYCAECGEIIKMNVNEETTTAEIMCAGWSHTKINVSCYRTGRGEYNIRAYSLDGREVKISSIPTETKSVDTVIKIQCDQYKEKSYSVALCLTKDGAYIPLRFVGKRQLDTKNIVGCTLEYINVSWNVFSGGVSVANIGNSDNQLRLSIFSDKISLDKSKKYSAYISVCDDGKLVLRSIKILK